MRNELNTNNSKKLIIGISIIFCAVILIIGVTTAFFTQSDTEDTGNIVTVDKVELEYNDNFDENTKFMRQELIPASYDNVIKAYTRKDTENKCLDSLGYSACSVYRFSIKNISNIVQELQMTLNPTVNSYTNLKFLLYEITENENKQRMNTTELVKDSKAAIPLYESYMLKPNEIRMFELIFYIEAKDYDQTGEDAGKQFGAGIRVDSITTGTYIVKNFGESCWTISGNTLTAFNGIDNNFTIKDAEGNDIKNPNYGKINESCTGYINDDDKDGYYSVYIPSNVGGQQVTTLDNMLFFAADTTAYALNNYSKINNIEIEEGITTIKDGVAVSSSSMMGTFIGVGVDEVDLSTFTIKKQHDVNIVLPSTLESIGSCAFALTGNKTISFNEKENKSKLNNIGTFAFALGSIESIIIPSVETIGNSAFDGSTIGKLTISGDIGNLGIEVFDKTTINQLVLEEGVTRIGDNLFYQANIIAGKDNPLIIPSSVVYIGNDAFHRNENLTKLIFAGSQTDRFEDGENKNLLTIGEGAFNFTDLTYRGTTEDDYLLLPARVDYMGEYAFGGGDGYALSNLKYIKYMGTREKLDSFGTSWYNEMAYTKPIITAIDD